MNRNIGRKWQTVLQYRASKCHRTSVISIAHKIVKQAWMKLRGLKPWPCCDLTGRIDDHHVTHHDSDIGIALKLLQELLHLILPPDVIMVGQKDNLTPGLLQRA